MSTHIEILEVFAESTATRRRPWLEGASVIERKGAREFRPRPYAVIERLERIRADEAALERLPARIALARFVSRDPHFPCQQCGPGVRGLCAVAISRWLEVRR